MFGILVVGFSTRQLKSMDGGFPRIDSSWLYNETSHHILLAIAQGGSNWKDNRVSLPAVLAT